MSLDYHDYTIQQTLLEFVTVLKSLKFMSPKEQLEMSELYARMKTPLIKYILPNQLLVDFYNQTKGRSGA